MKKDMLSALYLIGTVVVFATLLYVMVELFILPYIKG